MIYFYRTINMVAFDELYMHEKALLDDFKKNFINSYSEVLMKHKVHTEIHLCRWIDEVTRWHRKEYDGYTAMIQVDFLDDENSVIEIDEFVCSVFLVISYIAYFPLKRKYRVFQSDNLDELWDEIEIVIGLLDGV